MPACGSQVILCDVPIRFDTYEGCSHLCEYCFVQRKSDVFNNIKPRETVASLVNFIKGKRTGEVACCDWIYHCTGVGFPTHFSQQRERCTTP